MSAPWSNPWVVTIVGGVLVVRLFSPPDTVPIVDQPIRLGPVEYTIEPPQCEPKRLDEKRGFLVDVCGLPTQLANTSQTPVLAGGVEATLVSADGLRFPAVATLGRAFESTIARGKGARGEFRFVTTPNLVFKSVELVDPLTGDRGAATLSP